MKLKLILKKDGKIVETVEVLKFPFVIGRSEKCDLVLNEPHISREHAAIEMEKGKLALVNLSDTSKILLKEKPIESAELTFPISFEIAPFEIVLEELVPKKLPKDEPPRPKTEVLPEFLADEDISEPTETEEEFPVALDEESGLDETKITLQPAKAKLMILKGKSEHDSYDLIGDEVILGRDVECDVSLDDEKTSREHARISLKNQHYVIRDSGSSNGTFVNHQKVVEETVLSSGDQIQIGDTILQFAIVDEDAFAITPSDSSLRSEITQTGIVPHWGPDIPAYYPSSKGKGLFFRYKKIIYPSLGLLLLTMMYLTLTQPSQKRDTAQEGVSRKIAQEKKDELSKLTKVDRAYVKEKMKEAKDLFKNRKYRQSRIALQEIFAVVPNYNEARALDQTIRYTLTQQEREQLKRQGLLQEKKLHEEIKYHLSVGLDYFNRQQWGKAISEYDKILELKPDHGEAHQKRGLAQGKLDDKPKVKPEVSLKKRRNLKAEKLLAAGSRLSQKGNSLGALKTWRKVLKLEGISPKYYDKADRFVRFMKEKLNKQFLPLMTQANALIENKEHVQAQKILKSILKKYPSHVEAKEALSRTQSLLHQRARREYTEAIIEENVGRIDDAIRRFKWIVNRVPASDPYHRKAKKKLRKYE